MIEKIHQIKKSRLSKEDFKLFSLLEKLKIKKYKDVYLLVFNCDIYSEIDINNSIIWLDFNLFNLHSINLYTKENEYKKIKKGIKEYFNLDLQSYNVFSFPISYNKKCFYLGKTRKMNFFYNFICFFNKNGVSLSKIINNKK